MTSTSLLRLDLHSRKVCFSIATSHCCDDPLTEIDRFSVFVIRAGDPNNTCLIEYPMFEVNDEDQMCILLDSDMVKLCNGRYLFQIVFDECVIVDEVPFMWGGKPVLTSVGVESKTGSTEEGCFGEFETGIETGAKMPLTCCDKCDDGSDCGECEVCVPLAEHYPNGEYSPNIKPKKCDE